MFQEGVSLIYEGILPSKSPPKFTNLVTMMHPNDNMVIIVMAVVEFHSVTSAQWFLFY